MIKQERQIKSATHIKKINNRNKVLKALKLMVEKEDGGAMTTTVQGDGRTAAVTVQGNNGTTTAMVQGDGETTAAMLHG